MVLWSDMLQRVRAYVLKAQDTQDEAYTDAALTEWLKEAGREIVARKRHLFVGADGVPRGTSEVVGDSGFDGPEKYSGALLHGCLMFAFAEDHDRSSFERGLFNAQLQ